MELVVRGPVQRELQQLTGQRHQRTLNIRRLFASKTGRIVRIAQVLERQLQIRMINRALDDLSIHFKERSASGFGLRHSLTNGPLKENSFYLTFDRTKDLAATRHQPDRFPGKARYLIVHAKAVMPGPQTPTFAYPLSEGSAPKTPTLRQSLTQALRPDIGPVLFDVLQAGCTVRFTEYNAPAVRHVGKSRP